MVSATRDIGTTLFINVYVFVGHPLPAVKSHETNNKYQSDDKIFFIILDFPPSILDCFNFFSETISPGDMRHGRAICLSQLFSHSMLDEC